MLKSLLCGRVVETKALISLRNHNFLWFNFKAVNPAILSLANDIKQLSLRDIMVSPLLNQNKDLH